MNRLMRHISIYTILTPVALAYLYSQTLLQLKPRSVDSRRGLRAG
ncbi:MAG: hypothetical protein QW279_00935 [Candidatus Jordarchaeaceae archaeon]